MAFVKLGGLLVIVGMTALPFVSCGSVDFRGHELLRNRPPKEATDPLDRAQTGLTEWANKERAQRGDEPLDAETPAPEKPLFHDDSRWLHWLYCGVLLLGVAALFLRDRNPLAVLLGVVGAAGTLLFLNRFGDLLRAEAQDKFPFGGFRWEVGAYLTLAGFAATVLGGLGVVRLGRSGTVPP